MDALQLELQVLELHLGGGQMTRIFTLSLQSLRPLPQKKKKKIPKSRFSFFDPEPSWSQEAEEAIRSLDKQLHGEPRFQEPLRDASLHAGATACLACRLDG